MQHGCSFLEVLMDIEILQFALVLQVLKRVYTVVKLTWIRNSPYVER